MSHVADPYDVAGLVAAVEAAKIDPRPSIIMVKTTIGHGLPTKAGTEEAHGSPPGWDEIEAAKKAVNWPIEPRFWIPDDVREHFLSKVAEGENRQSEWERRFAAYEHAYPELAAELKRRMRGTLPEGWESVLPHYEPSEKGMSTRVASGKVINALAKALPELMGGSAEPPRISDCCCNISLTMSRTPGSRCMCAIGMTPR